MISDDRIEDWQVYEKERFAGVPKKIRVLAGTSKNAIVAWTARTGWVVYAENEKVSKRAFYFMEVVDDPDLSFRCMTGREP